MREWIDRLLGERSFEETLILMCLALAAVVITAAATIRVISGAWLIAAFDAAVLLLVLGLGTHVWRTREVERTGRIIAVLCLAVVVSLVYLFDPTMLYWSYPGTILTFFLLLNPRTALKFNAVAILALMPRAVDIGPWPDVATLVLTLLTSNLLAMLFAAHMRTSRARLRMMAERDALTGARNRHALDPMLRIALERRAQNQTPTSLMVVDLDHFKAVNDTHGHDVGDRVLREITGELIHSTRAGDDVFRYGGEELVILANGAPAEPAGRIAEKLRRQVERIHFDGIGRISISIGVAEARPDDSPGSWFRRADEWLYQAKRTGRNRTVVEGREVGDPEPDERLTPSRYP